MASKTIFCDYTEEYLSTQGAYHANADQCIFGQSGLPNVRCARVRFPDGLGIGNGIVTSAILHFRSYNMMHSVSRIMRFAASHTSAAFTISIASDYISQVLNPASETDFSIDITAKVNDLSDFNTTFYIFGFQYSPTANDNDYCIDWHGYGSSLYKPYLELVYTPANSTIGLYDGTLATFKDRIIKKRISGAWVQCDCFMYNDETEEWEKVSTT